MTQTNSLGDNARSMIEEYCELVLLKKDIEAKIKAMDPDIRPMLVGRGNILVSDKATIEVKQQKGRVTLDKKAMIADGMNLTPYEKQGAPFSTVSVKALA